MREITFNKDFCGAYRVHSGKILISGGQFVVSGKSNLKEEIIFIAKILYKCVAPYYKEKDIRYLRGRNYKSMKIYKSPLNTLITYRPRNRDIIKLELFLPGIELKKLVKLLDYLEKTSTYKRKSKNIYKWRR
jgi:hypothetical protein